MTTPGLPTPPRQCIDCGKPTSLYRQRCNTCIGIYHHKKREQSAYYHTPEWQTTRQLRITLDHQQCTLCTSTHRLTVHHVKARRDGGSDNISNLVTLCHTCHNKIESGVKGFIEALDEYVKHSPYNKDE